MLQLLTAADLADQLQVDQSTIYRWAADAKIPSIRLGEGVVRFSPVDISVWINESAKPAKVPERKTSRTARLREQIRERVAEAS